MVGHTDCHKDNVMRQRVPVDSWRSVGQGGGVAVVRGQSAVGG